MLRRLRLGVEKLLIGVIHLPPLPGAPDYKGELDEIISFAINEAFKLQEAGFDAIILENFNDRPFKVHVSEPETVAAMAVIARRVCEDLDLPVGVNMLRNSGRESLAVAYAAGASFIRVNSYCETRESPEGVLRPIARIVEEFRARYRASIDVLVDVDVKHSTPISHEYNAISAARECISRGRPDAIIVTGARTGASPPPGYVAAFRVLGVPIIVGSGITAENIRAYWRISDGFIVGTYIKDRETNRIVREKAEKLARRVRMLRKS